MRAARWLLLGAAAACTPASPTRPTDAPSKAQGDSQLEPPAPAPSAEAPDPWAAQRDDMVRLIMARGVADEAVVAAMAAVPRERFVPADVREHAYGDFPLPIGHDVTISQPYIVAFMTELAGIEAGSKVLEVGTGSGYQAAVLAEIGADVYSIEIVEPLAHSAEALLASMGYTTVHVRVGDGYAGWPEAAPFDAIVVTAAPPRVPEPLKAQLRDGGRLVIPVGDRHQELRIITRTTDGYDDQSVIPVRFVPMTGKAQD